MDERLTALIEALRDEEARTDELAGLSDEQLGATRDELRDLFRQVRAGEVDGVDPSDVGLLSGIHDAVRALETEMGAREEAAAARDEQIAAMEAELDGEQPDEPVDEVEEQVEEPEPVVAAPRKRASLSELAAQVPEQAKPKPNEMVAKPRWQTLDG